MDNSLSDRGAVANNLTKEPRAPSSSPTHGTEQRARFNFVALEAWVEGACRRWAVVWSYEVADAWPKALTSVVDSIEVPDFCAFMSEPDFFVAKQASRLVEETNRSALLPSSCEVFKQVDSKILGCAAKTTAALVR
jgi:hypothetical protein